MFQGFPPQVMNCFLCSALIVHLEELADLYTYKSCKVEISIHVFVPDNASSGLYSIF